jgi:aminopeptidase N
VGFDEEKKSVAGTTSITLTPLSTPIDSIVLDAEELKVQSVTLSSGTDLRYTNGPHELIVRLPHLYSILDTLTLAIHYSCTPKKGLYFISPDSSDPTRRHQIWTQGEDMDNRYWFPCYDFPDDKATSEVIAAVPERYTLVSNGRLVDVVRDQQTGTRTFHWQQSKPHSSYLIMLAAGEYEIVQEQCDSIPLQYYVYREYVNGMPRSFARTSAIMRFFEERTKFQYPWEKFAQVFLNQFPLGGMENTSVVTLNEIYMLDERAVVDFTCDDVIAHELAHQWWGDLVTCSDFTDLWLNEGFANYFEALFKEHDKGKDEFQYDMMQQAKSVRQTEERLGRKPIVSEDSYIANQYSKGCWVLSMLRTTLGELDFWKGMDLYLKRYAFKNAKTQDLQHAIEDATGRDLDWFFDQWAYKAGHPKLAVTTTWDEEDKILSITIKQTQTPDSLTGVFRFPLNIECTTSQGKFVESVWVNKEEETYKFHLAGKPLMVIVDKGMHLLCTLTFEKSVSEYIYQLAHADDVADRMVAAKELRRYKEDAEAFAALVQSALHDSFWAVRQEATVSVGVMKNEGVKDALFKIYRDRKSAVRRAAIIACEQFATPEVEAFLDSAARMDSSYLVLGSCITAMQSVDSVYAFEFARRYVGMSSYRDIVRRAALGVFRNLGDARALPYAIEYAAPGNAVDIRSLALGVLGVTGSADSQARLLLQRLANDENPTLRASAIRALGIWGDDEARAVIESRKKIEDDEGVKKAIDHALESIMSSSKNIKEK